MSPTREYSHARWHSRGGFLLTTLLVLTVMGAPFLATRGLLNHGALFLPAAAMLVLLLGGPLARLALAVGRLDHRATGRESLQSVQTLIRLVVACILVVLGTRAAAWLFAETVFGIPEGALSFQARELTVASTAWHGALTPALGWGAGCVGFITLIFLLFARRKRLAGLSWIAGWLLAVLVSLLMLGLVVGYSMPGVGALAALAAPVKLDALWTLVFWGDAAAVAMLAIGAQTGVLTAAGRGLPKRAAVGGEARILVTGAAFLLVLTGLAGLLLLSAVCFRQGIAPEPEHAAPGVLILEIVPLLGADLFQGWPPELRPTTRQVMLGWCFIVALTCCVGAAAMLGAQRLLPRDFKSRPAQIGYSAAAVCVIALVLSLALGTGDAYLPLLTVMPALLAVIRVTMARRAGAGMRVVSVAFHSSRPWLERLYLTFAFRVTRPLLLAAVIAVALSRSEYSIMLAGFALAFALIWVGSLLRRQRSSETGMIRAVAPLLVLALLPALSAATPERRAFDALVAEPTAARRLEFEAQAMRALAEGREVDAAPYREAAHALLHPEPGAARADATRAARAALACAMLLEPAHDDALRLERELLELDHVAPFPQLDEAFSDHAAGDPEPLHRRLRAIDARLNGPRIHTALEESPNNGPVLMLALGVDLRHAYGAAGPRGRELRRYLVQRATSGRTLLEPDVGPGLTYLLCFLLSALALATALTLSIGRK